MCLFCAPMTLEPDAAERERVLRRLAEFEPDESAPAGAAALLAWSGAPGPAAFSCEEAPNEPVGARPRPDDRRPLRFRSTEC